MGFTVEKGSEKGGVSRRCLERPLREYAPLGVRPSVAKCWFWGLEHVLRHL